MSRPSSFAVVVLVLGFAARVAAQSHGKEVHPPAAPQHSASGHAAAPPPSPAAGAHATPPPEGKSEKEKPATTNRPAAVSISPNLSMKEVRIAVKRLRQKIADSAAEPSETVASPQATASASKHEESPRRIRLTWRATLTWPTEQTEGVAPESLPVDRVSLSWPKQ